MRLSNRMKDMIKNSIMNSFGNVDVYLFGSRVDDKKEGGDIDLAINVDLSREEFRAKKIEFISCLIKSGWDLKIDIVPYHNADPLLFSEIQQESIKIL